MRLSFSCNDKAYDSIENMLNAHGLKSLFLKNILDNLKDENGEIPEERILAVLMNKFTISFNGVNADGESGRDDMSEIDKLSEIAKGFG